MNFIEEEAKFREYINKSLARVLEMAPDWDDEGALLCDKETADKARAFLILLFQSTYFHEREKSILIYPLISLCDDGSIDIYWREGATRLLLNLESGSDEVSFSGQIIENEEFSKQINGVAKIFHDFPFVSYLGLVQKNEN